MQDTPQHQRPSFDEALREWQKILTDCGYPTACNWILDENLVFEKDTASPTGVRLAFQTRFTLLPADVAGLAYDFFAEWETRIVFYRLGTAGGKSICMLLCDPVFENRAESDGFRRRDAWKISFFPGETLAIEEITDESRWKNRLLTGRPLADVDFCMPLSAVRELEVHGRVLTPYERFGVKIVDAWQRWQRSSGE